MAAPPIKDDTFTLHDLRVTVVCPPGERILCGAKEGDYFTLEGEMLYLPPGQGISIYSLGKPPSTPMNYLLTYLTRFDSLRPPAAGSKAARHARQRLDDLGRPGRVPGPELQVGAQDRAHGHAGV